MTNYSWYTSASPSQFEKLEQVSNLDSSSNNLTQYGYQYSAVGDITQWTQKVTTGATNTIALGYDLADQLTSATGTSPWSYSYAYDNAANRTSVTSSGTPTTATINNLNQVTALSGGTTATLTYDSDGNMTSDGTNSYSYDAENRLVQVTYPGVGNNSQIYYDAVGGRVKIVETVSSSVTSTKQFVTSAGTPIEERDGSSAITKQFFNWGQTLSGSNYFYTRDHLGSVRDMTDSGGSIQAHYEYDPWGVATKTAGSLASDFQYAGYYFHAPSGLNLCTYRAYNPSLGRFTSRDPIHDMTFRKRPRSMDPGNPDSMSMAAIFSPNPGSMRLTALSLPTRDRVLLSRLRNLVPTPPHPKNTANSYVYAANNPISWTDPSGLQCRVPGEKEAGCVVFCAGLCAWADGTDDYFECFWDCYDFCVSD